MTKRLLLNPVMISLRQALVLPVSLLALSGCTLSPEFESDGSAVIVDDKKTDPDVPDGMTSINLGQGGETGTTGGTGGSSQAAGVCGNGELEWDEVCDDGGTKGGDGCSKDCQVQDPEFDCSKAGEPCIDTVICGNGVLEGDEVCDDNNSTGNDGCAADCKSLDEGYACARPGVNCLKLPVCGNGQRERGEQCDDGDDTDGLDGCHECQQAADFFCVPGSPCTPIACGDGNRTPGEQCDDGPGTLGSPGSPVGGDGCSATCTVEAGYRCSDTGCFEDCGDGQIVGSEECDDDGRQSGDGCSATCKLEDFYSCTGAPSTCTSTIDCDNGVREPGEICDPGADAGCLADCSGYSVPGSVCGNDIVEPGETCEISHTGCNPSTCRAQAGWSCPSPTTCFELPRCGDAIWHALAPRNEECDDGNADNGDGCRTDCTVTPGWACNGAGPSTCVEEVCGDGTRTDSEECDEGSVATTVGCIMCNVQPGWVCPTAGEPCFERCGDGQTVGSEQCDDGPGTPALPGIPVGGDGCTAGCQIEFGYTCPIEGAACSPSECGNGTPDLPGTPSVNEAQEAAESGEGCDDGNTVSGDGCSGTCQNEPRVTRDPMQSYPEPLINAVCGDGVMVSGESCDDGNTTAGDGCDELCAPEDGFVCVPKTTLPGFVDMAVTYRDFKRDDDAGGHPNFESGISDRANMVGPPCTTAAAGVCDSAPGALCPANTCGMLDVDGKPVFHIPSSSSLDDRARVDSWESFAIWYRDTNTYGVLDESADPKEPTEIFVVPDTLRLVQHPTITDRYEYPASGQPTGDFYPLTGRAFGNTPGQTRNYHFTTELRYFFQYKGGETLTFEGDDDVWVFVNGRLAVDIGGVHGRQYGRVVLGDDGEVGSASLGGDSDCSVHRGGSLPGLGTCYTDSPGGAIDSEAEDDSDERFGLVVGGVYEIVLFQAERHTSQSNFKLTLQGFLAPRSDCQPECGDGKVVGSEVCDDGPGNNYPNPDSGQCNDTCTGRAYCGDGIPQPSEECDNGSNLDLYATGIGGQCAPGCLNPPTCGDTLQPAFELCDLGGSNSATAYGVNTCTTECVPGGYCGDDTVDAGHELCDNGLDNGIYSPIQANSCSTLCQQGPYCGDGTRNGPEQCDDANNVDDDACANNCTKNPYCGDGEVGGSEVCDNGTANNTSGYGECTSLCTLGPRCGDGARQDLYEECDLPSGNDNSYDGCSATCFLGPRCGDGALQGAEGEQCDNGFNTDTYALAEGSCGPNCVNVPYCGDGSLQAAFELCDDGLENVPATGDAYDKCTDSCDYGPYCGDGVLQSAHEDCDDGLQNTAYSASGTACGYDCKVAASCGDGERNGPEQCDLGASKNTGAYGGCKADCTRAPYCGDKQVQTGEQCDAGPTGSLNCSPSCTLRDVVK